MKKTRTLKNNTIKKVTKDFIREITQNITKDQTKMKFEVDVDNVVKKGKKTSLRTRTLLANAFETNLKKKGKSKRKL